MPRELTSSPSSRLGGFPSLESYQAFYKALETPPSKDCRKLEAEVYSQDHPALSSTAKHEWMSSPVHLRV